MNRYALLIELNNVCCELESKGKHVEAARIHEVFTKIAANEPWYYNKNTLFAVLTLAGIVAGTTTKMIQTLLENPTKILQNYNISEFKPFGKGAKHTAVGAWQSYLNANSNANLDVDNDFGQATVDATVNFQRSQSIPATGVVDSQTFKSAILNNPKDPNLSSLVKIEQLITPKQTELQPEQMVQDPLYDKPVVEQPAPKTIEEQPVKKVAPRPKAKMPAKKRIRLKTIEDMDAGKITGRERKTVKKHWLVFDSKKNKGIPFETNPAEVYEIYKKFRNRQEGGAVNMKTDPGGETNYGITQKHYNGLVRAYGFPAKSVFDLTQEEAEKAAFVDWQELGVSKLPANTAIALADIKFNSGLGWVTMILRDALGIKQKPLNLTSTSQEKAEVDAMIEQLTKKITSQELDEYYAAKIIRSRAKFLAGARAKGKVGKTPMPTMVAHRGLIDRLHEISKLTGNDSDWDEVYRNMPRSRGKRFKYIKDYGLHRPTPEFPGAK
jgi:peptidoglycan hydrolase-like protein with peptidoglycan-binding domain